MKEIYLASASPRRKELLARLGVDCKVMPVDLDESRLPGETGEAYVSRLALEKGRLAFARLNRPDIPVVAADTAVVLGETILGKPVDEADAERMLSLLSNRVHEVYTAVAVLTRGKEETALSRSEVRFRSLSGGEISAYWRTGEPQDKAGAYGIQGLGAIFVQELQGSYSGVMGLPLFETARLLKSAGVDVLQDTR